MESIDLISGGTPSDVAVLLIFAKWALSKIQERWSKQDREAKEEVEAKAKEGSREKLEQISRSIEGVTGIVNEFFEYASKPNGEGYLKLKESVHLAYTNKEAISTIGKQLDTNGPVSKQLDRIEANGLEVFDRQTQVIGKIEALER